MSDLGVTTPTCELCNQPRSGLLACDTKKIFHLDPCKGCERLSAACAEAMGWKPPGHYRTQQLIEACYADGCAADLSDQWREPREGKLDTPPEYLGDANAAMELRRKMADESAVTLEVGPTKTVCKAKRRTLRDDNVVQRDGPWEIAANENAATVYCFLRFHDLDPEAIAEGRDV